MLGPSLTCSAGKTCLINVLLGRGRRSDAHLAAAYEKDPAPQAELLSNKVSDDDAQSAILAALPFDPLPPGCTLSLEDFEKSVHETDAYKQALKLIERSVEQRRALKEDFETVLPYRGPFISLPEKYTKASTFTPMLVDSNKEDSWLIEIRFRNADDLRRALDESIAAFKKLQAGEQAADTAEDEALGGGDALYFAELGRDMLGFGGKKYQRPGRLADVDPDAWTLPPWLRLFVGKTLRIPVTARTWEEGCERVHDILLTYTRDVVGLWALIDVGGLRVLAPASLASPMLDAQGPLEDDTSRNGTLSRTLLQEAPHAYVFIMHKEVQGNLAQVRDRVTSALAAEAGLGNNEGLEEAAPARIFAVRVADKHAALDSAEDLLPDTTDPKSSTAEEVRAEMRTQTWRAFRAGGQDDEALFKAVRCHSVTPMRKLAFGVAELEEDLGASFVRTQNAELRHITHALLRTARTALGLFDTAMSAADGDAGGAQNQAAQQARLRLERELAREKERLAMLFTKQQARANESNKQSLFEQAMSELILREVATPLWEHLRDELTAAAGANLDLPAALNEQGLGPALQDGTPRERSQKQLEHMRTCSRDSKVLTALLQPLLGSMSRYSRTTLAFMAFGHRIIDNVTTLVLNRLLLDSPLAQLSGMRELDVTDADQRARVQQWLFVQHLRLLIARELGGMQAALAAITDADLREAAFRCSAALEHYQAVHETVLKKAGRKKDDASYSRRNSELAAEQPAMLKGVAASLAEFIGAYFYNLAYDAAERTNNACLAVCSRGGAHGASAPLPRSGDESDGEEDGLAKIARAAQLLHDTQGANGNAAAAGAAAAGAAAVAAVGPDVRAELQSIRTAVAELCQQLDVHGFPYDRALAPGATAAQLASPSRADDIFRRVLTRGTAKRKRDEEEGRLRAELGAMTVEQLQQRAQHKGHDISGCARKADLVRRIAALESGAPVATARARYN